MCRKDSPDFAMPLPFAVTERYASQAARQPVRIKAFWLNIGQQL
jgi:hypothetical protein